MTGDRLEPLRRVARCVPGGMALGRWLRGLADPEARALARLRRREPHLLQPWGDTAEDRYPLLFDALAAHLAAIPAPRILSFGCSTGAEARALKRRITAAVITGIDINPRAIEAASAADPQGCYRVADRPDPAARYDAVLALAVLRHGELEARRPDDCGAILPFARFAEAMARLDAVLMPGGWLAIANAHFRFADSPAAAHYAADPLRLDDTPAQDLVYGPDNRRIDGARYDDVLFRKRQGFVASS